MNDHTEQKLDELLQQARTSIPSHNSETMFRHILDTLEHTPQPAVVSYRKLRNAGISLLVLLAINIGAWALAGKAGQSREPDTAAGETFLQSYNLNLYGS